MARRKRGFDWVREDQDEEARELVERRDQAGMKALRDRKQTMVKAMVALSNTALSRLPIDDDVRDGVVKLKATPPSPGRKRQLLRVVGLMVETDLDAVDAALAGDTEHDAYLRSMERWRTRMLQGDDADVAAFVEAFPSADPQSLRQLIRQAKKGDTKALKASKKLFQALKEAAPAP